MNVKCIMFLHFIFSLFFLSIFVDGIPIRDFKNNEKKGVLFPSSQPLRMYGSLWNGEAWATQGGRVKTDWSKAPFVAMYRNYKVDVCSSSGGKSNCNSKPWWNYNVTGNSYRQMRAIQRKFMIYNYCDDVNRFPKGLPLECKLPWISFRIWSRRIYWKTRNKIRSQRRN